MSRHGLARLYRRRAQKMHPDKGGDNDKFIKLTQAYHDLLKTKAL
jgi:DnaJ-class molecular chaperone